MLIVLALGGNTLLRRGEPPEADIQRHNLVAAVVRSVAPLAHHHQVVITHSNGPQIGLLALPAAAQMSDHTHSMCSVRRVRE